MYGWIWRKLPGHWSLKALQSLVLVLGISALLVVVVFPWIEPKLPFSGNTVDGNTEDVPSSTPTTTAPTTKAPTTTEVPTPTASDTEDEVIPGDG